MRAEDWLAATIQRFTDADIPTARLDCLVLLEDATGKDRAWLLAHPEHILEQSSVLRLEGRVAQRTRHIPLAYIRGKAEFYGREFKVTSNTLVPRPETETIIDLLKSLRLPSKSRILDVGTGSGCIAITVSLELKEFEVDGSDIDVRCLKIARENAQALNAKIHFFLSDLLEHATTYDVLLANLPYVPDNFQINTAATHEPAHALFGGADGLDLYRALFTQLHTHDTKPRYVLTESLPPQHKNLATIAKAVGYTLWHTDDFIQVFELV
jgi:release factor glutamine methyltransferase